MGCGEAGCLGHGNEIDLTSPQRVILSTCHESNSEPFWVSVACGSQSTLGIAQNGAVFGWGWGEGGVLGLGDVDCVLIPRKLTRWRVHKPNIHPTHSLESSLGTQAIRSNQSNQNDHSFMSTKEDWINAESVTIVGVSCGKEHSLFRTNEGRLFACGIGYNGCLGLKQVKIAEFPTEISFSEV